MKFDAVGQLVFLFSPFLRQEQAHCILNGTSLRRSGTWTFFVSERNTLLTVSFCIERISFANQEEATARAPWPSGQVSALCAGS